MATYIEFYNAKLDGKLGPAMGSEGFQPIDGRYGIERAISEARKRALKLRNVQSYRGFKIVRGTILRNSSITPLILL